MSKLLRSGIFRYIHSILFWISVVASLIIGLLIGTGMDEYASFGNIYVIAELLIFAVLISVSIGKEYSDGGFRNKVILGYTKGKIFWSEWILGIGISLLLFVICAIPIAVMNGTEIFEAVATNYIVKIGIGMALLNVSSMVLSIFISTAVSNKVIAPIVNILLVVCLLVAAGQISGRLTQPKHEYYYEFNQETGEYDEYLSDEINPRYIDEPLRTVLEVSLDLFPQGQIVEYEDILYQLHAYIDYDYDTESWIPAKCSTEDEKALNTHPFYSLALIAVVSVTGYLCFRKKELK